ncbi:MAG: hypothetical protein IKP58_13670 [Victivallales bacterium]|nr:hypothetical protein [Victivallales bacterium]
MNVVKAKKRTKSEDAKKQYNPLLEFWLRLCLAVVATLAIHVPFALMKGNPPPPSQELDFGETTQAVSLPASDESMPDSIKAIYAWTEINDPTLLILPNAKLGFSQFVPPTQPIDKKEVEPIKEERAELPPPPSPNIPLSIDVASLEQLISANWNKTTTITLPTAPPIIPPHGVFWRSEDGRLLKNPPESDVNQQTLAIGHGIPEQTTTIEIAPSSLLPTPRVIVRRSCGNAELDMVALNAVRLALAKAGRLPLAPGYGPDKPLTLVIDWHF